MSGKQRVFFKTFGCRTNQYDTQVMIANLGKYVLAQSEADADIVVINSCTVTNGADSSVRHYLNTVSRKHPEARVVMAGCGSYVQGKDLQQQGRLFGVMGHSEKENIGTLLQNKDLFYAIGDLEHVDGTIVENFVGKSRAFIKIQEGCDFGCSYCIVPQVRGRARSRDEETVVRQVEVLAAHGFGEFILTGTNVGSYGKDRGSSIAQLLKRLSRLRGVRRIRIGSLEPVQIDAEFKELLGEPWMARHLHIALQHTSDRMLEIMNRRNRFAEDQKLFEEIATRGYALGTDFIVGHPGEDEAAWQEAMERIEQLPLTHIHAFTYSRRDNTPSAVMKEIVRGDVAKVRHAQLTELIAKKNYAFRRLHQRDLVVLCERGQQGKFAGFDQYFNRLNIESSEELSGNWLQLNSVEVMRDGNYALYT